MLFTLIETKIPLLYTCSLRLYIQYYSNKHPEHACVVTSDSNATSVGASSASDVSKGATAGLLDTQEPRVAKLRYPFVVM